MVNKLTKKDLTPCLDCACFNIRKATRVLTQHFDETMQASGLRGTQFTILAVIAGNDSLTISDLADKLVMDRTTLTRNLAPLEKQGLIKMAAGVDRRTRTASLTDKGHKIMLHALPLWKKAQKDIKSYFGSKRFNLLLGELRFIEKMAIRH